MLGEIWEEVIATILFSGFSIIGIALKKSIAKHNSKQKLTKLYHKVKNRLEKLQTHEIVMHFQRAKVEGLLGELCSIDQEQIAITQKIDKYYNLLKRADSLELEALDSYQHIERGSE